MYPDWQPVEGLASPRLCSISGMTSWYSCDDCRRNIQNAFSRSAPGRHPSCCFRGNRFRHEYAFWAETVSMVALSELRFAMTSPKDTGSHRGGTETVENTVHSIGAVERESADDTETFSTYIFLRNVFYGFPSKKENSAIPSFKINKTFNNSFRFECSQQIAKMFEFPQKCTRKFTRKFTWNVTSLPQNYLKKSKFHSSKILNSAESSKFSKRKTAQTNAAKKLTSARLKPSQHTDGIVESA